MDVINIYGSWPIAVFFKSGAVKKPTLRPRYINILNSCWFSRINPVVNEIIRIEQKKMKETREKFADKSPAGRNK